MSRLSKVKIIAVSLLFIVAFVFPVTADELNDALQKLGISRISC